MVFPAKLLLFPAFGRTESLMAGLLTMRTSQMSTRGDFVKKTESVRRRPFIKA
jgi:hypothetical protein